MSWKGGYFYQSRRLGNRVITKYLGAGPIAHLAAQKIAQDGKRREAERRARELELALDREFGEVDARIRLLADGVMVLRGYHEHHGNWRRRRA